MKISTHITDFERSQTVRDGPIHLFRGVRLQSDSDLKILALDDVLPRFGHVKPLPGA